MEFSGIITLIFFYTQDTGHRTQDTEYMTYSSYWGRVPIMILKAFVRNKILCSLRNKTVGGSNIYAFLRNERKLTLEENWDRFWYLALDSNDLSRAPCSGASAPNAWPKNTLDNNKLKLLHRNYIYIDKNNFKLNKDILIFFWVVILIKYIFLWNIQNFWKKWLYTLF